MRPLFTRFTAHLSAGLADITEEGLTRCFAHTTPIEFALQCTTSEPFHCLCQQIGSRNYRFYRWTNLEVIHDYGIIELLVLIIINILLY